MRTGIVRARFHSHKKRKKIVGLGELLDDGQHVTRLYRELNFHLMNMQKLSGSEHFWKMRSGKGAGC